MNVAIEMDDFPFNKVPQNSIHIPKKIRTDPKTDYLVLAWQRPQSNYIFNIVCHGLALFHQDCENIGLSFKRLRSFLTPNNWFKKIFFSIVFIVKHYAQL